MDAGSGVDLLSAAVNALAEPAVTVASHRWFHSRAVLTKKEFLYCSVLQAGIWKPLEFLVACLSSMLVVAWSSYLVGLILRQLEFAGVRKSWRVSSQDS